MLRGRGGQKALIYDSPVTKQTKSFTYAQLRDEVAVFGAVLQDLGVKKGDRVIIYLPMIPEAAIAMLACARIGAIHSVVFGGFAASELATRLDDSQTRRHRFGELRHRDGARHPLQAAARQGDRAGNA